MRPIIGQELQANWMVALKKKRSNKELGITRRRQKKDKKEWQTGHDKQAVKAKRVSPLQKKTNGQLTKKGGVQGR